jgi:hypothetical protein
MTARTAVALGDPVRIKALFDADPAAFHRQVRVWRGGLLVLSVALKRPDLVRLLLNLGLDPDEPGPMTDREHELFDIGQPLWAAVNLGDYETARILLEAGADPMARTPPRSSAMSQAFARRDDRIKELLYSFGARPDPAAIGQAGDIPAARALLQEIDERGERPDLSSGQPRSETEALLWAAARGGSPEIMALCLPRINLKADDPRWFDLLVQPLKIGTWNPFRTFHNVDRSNYQVCLRLMLEHGASPNVAGPLGRRLLHDVAAAPAPGSRDPVRAGMGGLRPPAGRRRRAPGYSR